MFQNKIVDKIKTHLVLSIFFFENPAIYEIIWEKNILERGTPHMTTWPMRIACWVTKATITRRLRNISCFSTATMVARMCLNITSYLRCLSS